MFAKHLDTRSQRGSNSVNVQWPVRSDTMLTIEGIDLYYGRAQALRGVSLTAEIGKVTTVLGRNGVGKTSLLRALTGHVPIAKGRIHWEGRDITAASPSDRARAGPPPHRPMRVLC